MSEKIDKERRDLYAVSIALILYTVSGARLKSEFGSFVGVMELKSPEVLLIAACLAWFYFFWRFALVSNDSWRRFQDDVDHWIDASPTYRKFSDKLMAERTLLFNELLSASQASGKAAVHNGKKITREELLGARDSLKTAFERAKDGRLAIQRRSFLRSIKNWEVTSSGVTQARATPVVNLFPEEEAVPALLRLRIVSGAMARAMFKSNTFTDEVLPVLVAVPAPFIFAWGQIL